MAESIQTAQDLIGRTPPNSSRSAVLWTLLLSAAIGAFAALVAYYSPPVSWFLYGVALVTFFVVWYLSRGRPLFFDVVFIGLLLGTVAGDRAFAHLGVNVGPLPIYVTDAALAALMFGVFLSRKLTEEAQVFGRSAIPFLPYLLWGTLLFGFALPFYGAEAIRDYALFYYSAFILVGIVAVRRTTRARFAAVFALAAVIVVLRATIFQGSLDIGYGLTRAIAGYSSFYLTAGILVALAAFPIAGYRARLGIGFSCLIALAVIYVSETRAAWLGLLVGLGFLAVLHPSWRRHFPKLLLGGAMATILLGVVAIVGDQGTALATPAAAIHRLVIGLTAPSADPTAQFRLNAWSTAWSLISANPISGGQIGIPFQFTDQGYTISVPPHNTYLNLLLKSGFVGLALLAIPLGILYLRVTGKLLDGAVPLRERSVLAGMCAAQLSFATFGGFALLLESPFLAWPYWALIGAMIGLSAKRARGQLASNRLMGGPDHSVGARPTSGHHLVPSSVAKRPTTK